MLNNIEVSISPYVMAKIKYFRSKSNNEFSGFGISESVEEPLNIVDFISVKQTVASATVELDDIAVAQFYDKMALLGKQPLEYGRVWLHAHPNMNTTPSVTDWTTFREVFAECNWAVMLVIGDNIINGCISYKLFGNKKSELPIEAHVDWNMDFDGSNKTEWEKEYTANMHKKVYAFQQNNAEIMYDYMGGFWVQKDNKKKKDNKHIKLLPNINGNVANRMRINKALPPATLMDIYNKYIDRVPVKESVITFSEFVTLYDMGYDIKSILTMGDVLCGYRQCRNVKEADLIRKAKIIKQNNIGK